jgi:hypothetical protein
MYGQKSYGYDEIGNITFKDRANCATFDSVTTIYVDNHYEKEGSTVRTYKAFVRTPLRRVARGWRCGMAAPSTTSSPITAIFDGLGSTAITANSDRRIMSESVLVSSILNTKEELTQSR